MTTACIVIAAVLLFLLLLALLPIHILCRADTGAENPFSVGIRVLFITIPLFPRKKKRPDLRRFRIKVLRKRGRQLARKEEQQREKKKRGALKKAKKKKKEEAKAQKRYEKTGLKPKKRSFLHILKLIRALAGALLTRFGRYLRIDIACLDITAAAGDPATAAILYGSLYAALETFWQELCTLPPLKGLKKEAISLNVDYFAERPSVRARITFTICVWHIFALLIAGGGAALSVQNEARKKEGAEERAARQRREAEARAQMVAELKRPS